MIAALFKQRERNAKERTKLHSPENTSAPAVGERDKDSWVASFKRSLRALKFGYNDFPKAAFRAGPFLAPPKTLRLANCLLRRAV
jgi:hypothetical protein